MSGAIAKWHAYMESGDPQVLSALLDDDVVFESPVVHTPQRGKEITFKYLMAAAKVLGGPEFTYLNEWKADDSDILEFQTRIDGISINGVDMIWWNAAGRIIRFKVMVRPLKAINLLHQMMGAQLTSG
jgi:ketosteroid isomerase-like protein